MLRKHTDEREQYGIVERMPYDETPYVVSVPLVVDKRDDHGNVTGKRVVFDARKLNQQTRRRIVVYGVERKTNIDLGQGALISAVRAGATVAVADGDVGQQQMTRMILGLHSAPATAQATSD